MQQIPMQQIHVGNLAAYEARQAATAHAAALARDVEGEIVDFFITHPQCTRDDMLSAGFSAREIDRYAEGARRKAARRWLKRVA